MALGLGLGYAAGGAAQGLTDLWKIRLLEQEAEQRAAAEKFHEVMAGKQFTLQEQEAQRARQRLTMEQQQQETNLGLKKLDLLTGRPLSELSDVSTARLNAQPGLPTLMPQTSVMTQQGGSPLGPGRPNFQPGITADITPINVPGIGPIRPQSFEQLRSQAQEAEYQKPYTLGRGDIRYIGNQPVAAGPAFETPQRALQSKTVSVGGKNVLAGWDPDTNTYFRGQQPIGTPEPEIPPPPQLNALQRRQLEQMTQASDIKPGSQYYKQAQDLADGSLSLQAFQRLHSRSQASEATRSAIYSLARDLNPNFNPSAYEIGFRFASNPVTQRQIAGIKNVESGASDLLKASDAAERSGVTAMNQYALKPIGLKLGNKSYSNFAVAVTAFADELSGALGYGTATDMSREMGYDMTNMDLSPENFRSAMETVVLPFVARKKASILGQMGPYGQETQGGAQTPGPTGPAADPLGIRKGG